MSSNYPPNWDSIRKRVYKRDNHTCQNCGIKGGSSGNAEIRAHHGVPLQKGGSNKLTNLTTYCKKCHNSIHHDNKQAPTANSQHRNSTSTRTSQITSDCYCGNGEQSSYQKLEDSSYGNKRKMSTADAVVGIIVAFTILVLSWGSLFAGRPIVSLIVLVVGIGLFVATTEDGREAGREFITDLEK